VDVSWSPDGQVDVEIFTGKSFMTRDQAQKAGMKMGINWIDSWKKPMKKPSMIDAQAR
jgi:hypothetical protein